VQPAQDGINARVQVRGDARHALAHAAELPIQQRQHDALVDEHRQRDNHEQLQPGFHSSSLRTY